jgi:hypothetical protein
VEVELKLLAFDIIRPELYWRKSIPGYKEVISLAEVKSIKHVTDAGVFIKNHVFLHAIVL